MEVKINTQNIKQENSKFILDALLVNYSSKEADEFLKLYDPWLEQYENNTCYLDHLICNLNNDSSVDLFIKCLKHHSAPDASTWSDRLSKKNKNLYYYYNNNKDFNSDNYFSWQMALSLSSTPVLEEYLKAGGTINENIKNDFFKFSVKTIELENWVKTCYENKIDLSNGNLAFFAESIKRQFSNKTEVDNFFNTYRSIRKKYCKQTEAENNWEEFLENIILANGFKSLSSKEKMLDKVFYTEEKYQDVFFKTFTMLSIQYLTANNNRYERNDNLNGVIKVCYRYINSLKNLKKENKLLMGSLCLLLSNSMYDFKSPIILSDLNIDLVDASLNVNNYVNKNMSDFNLEGVFTLNNVDGVRLLKKALDANLNEDILIFTKYNKFGYLFNNDVFEHKDFKSLNDAQKFYYFFNILYHYNSVDRRINIKEIVNFWDNSKESLNEHVLSNIKKRTPKILENISKYKNDEEYTRRISDFVNDLENFITKKALLKEINLGGSQSSKKRKM